MLSRTKLLAAAALTAPLLALSGTPANAGALVGSVTGTGVLSPGIPLLPTDCAVQSVVNFDAILAVGAGDGHGGIYDVKFRGNSGAHCESVLSGEGDGLLSGNVSGSVHYSRTGGALTISGSVTVDGHSHTLLVAECELSVTTSVNPIKDFALTCEVILTVP
jgi:hypothetical protein